VTARATAQRALAAALLAAAALAPPAGAWLVKGHERVTIDAIALLPESVPGFFRGGAAIAGHASVDPDLWRNPGTPELAARSGPEHYLDLELLRGEALPERRSDYLTLLARLRVEPHRAGALPYAIVEGAERLALCFSEHRRWPADETIRAKCLLAAGWLAHFAADLAQPLHTTIHHDGRTLPDGRSPRSGIHSRVDGLFAPRYLAGRGLLAGVAPARFDELWPALRAELAASHALVDRVYELERAIGGRGARVDPRVAAFARERYRATARFVAGVLLWSWERAAAIELPEWLAR
jgi:hypothetical protein